MNCSGDVDPGRGIFLDVASRDTALQLIQKAMDVRNIQSPQVAHMVPPPGDIENARDRCLIETVFDHLRRRASNNGERRHVVDDDRTRCNHGAMADRYPTPDQGRVADPDLFLHDQRSAIGLLEGRHLGAHAEPLFYPIRVIIPARKRMRADAIQLMLVSDQPRIRRDAAISPNLSPASKSGMHIGKCPAIAESAPARHGRKRLDDNGRLDRYRFAFTVYAPNLERMEKIDALSGE